jgi:O-antigen/teichoic acid export membrane protein
LVSVITGSMTSVLMVDYRKLLSDGDNQEVLRLLHRAMIKSGTILIPTMFFLLCVAPEFMSFLYGDRYRGSSSVFRVYLLLLPVRTLVFGSVALAAGRTKELAVVPVIAIAVNATLNYFAIRRFGAIGAACASVFTIYMIGAYGRALIAKKILKCSMWEFIPWGRMCQLFFAGGLAVPFVLLTRHQMLGRSDLLLLLTSSSVFLCICGLSLVYFGFVDAHALRRHLLRLAHRTHS